MKQLAELVPAVMGRPAVIMGGAPSLPDDIKQVDCGDAIWFSANQHGAMLRECDYVVYVDPVHQVTRERMQEKLSEFGAPTISPVFGADYRLTNWNETGFLGNCGLHAIWIASMLGANPVIVCGIECYQGGVYWHDTNASSSSRGRRKSFFDTRIESLKKLVAGANVRAVTEVMKQHFPAYDASEEVGPSCAEIAATETLVPVKFRSRARIAKTIYGRGQTAMLTESEAHFFRKHIRRCDNG